MSDIQLSHQSNPGAIGANLGLIYLNNSGFLCFVGNDGTEHQALFTTANVVTANVNLSLGDTGAGFKELFLDYTNTATVGAVTINKSSGRVNVAAGASNVVVTCNLVTANSHVFATASQNDTTGYVKSVVPSAGNFTIYCNAPTANMSVDFLVVGA